MDRPGSLPYFATLVDQIVGTYLRANGFTQIDGSPSGVTYRRGGIVTSLEYWDEDRPMPYVHLNLGLIADAGRTPLVGLWRGFSPDEPARAYTTWRFHDPTSLADVLRRIVTEVLMVHGPRLWESPNEIARLLDAQADEVEGRHPADRHEADLTQARRAFDEGRFQDAVDRFVLVDPTSLSAGDQRRLYEARQHLRKGPAGAG